jgi:hypothetical protein
MTVIKFSARLADAGIHQCRLEEISEVDGRIRWLFVTDNGEEIIRKYGVSWRVGSGNHRLLEELTGQKFAPGEMYDPASLVGSRYKATVVGSDDTFSVAFKPIVGDAT